MYVGYINRRGRKDEAKLYAALRAMRAFIRVLQSWDFEAANLALLMGILKK